MLALAPPVTRRAAIAQLPRTTPARGVRRGRIALMQGCVQRVFFGDVNAATVRVLSAEGWEVHAPRAPRCCGALQLHSGEDAPARARAKETIEAFEDYDVVVVNAAGCGSAMKDYGHVLRDDPEWKDRAEAFAAKGRDVSELLADVEPRAERGPLTDTRIDKLAYHDACHLAHAQGVRAQPRRLLDAIPGLELKEIAEPELCCGSAGIYNILNPEPARELGDRKAANIVATGAQVLVTANPGCLMQVAAAVRRRGGTIALAHTAHVLDASIRGLSADALGYPRAGSTTPATSPSAIRPPDVPGAV